MRKGQREVIFSALFLFLNMKNIFAICLTVLLTTGCSHSSKPGKILLFQAGADGYECFRIPALINTGKTLLAFAEGRKNGCSDTGDIDLVMKRSTDNGQTWSDLMVIWDAGDDVAGNPAPVYDSKIKTVFLLSTWNLGSDHESRIIDQTSENTRRVFVLSSEDEGYTWSGAKEITETTKQENWTWYATGPVHGIQLRNGENAGRLIIPCDHIEADTKHYYSHVIYSDDHGKSWILGGSTPQHQVNECTVAELSDGDLMLNMRNYDRNFRTRKVSISKNGGNTWSDIYPDDALPEPICQASLLSDFSSKPAPTLYFINPSSASGRENMTVKISYNQGTSWTDSTILHPGPSAYSDICLIQKDALGCLYEGGENSPYEGIYFELIQKPSRSSDN